MSRGFGRGGRGGKGGGRGGFGGLNNLLPMGISFADLQNLSWEASALYPQMPVPTFSEPTDVEKSIAEFQTAYASRMRKSQYYITERTKSVDLERYSDKYRPSVKSQPSLKRKELHEPFFPREILEDYFNPKRKKKPHLHGKQSKGKLNIDDLVEDRLEQEKSTDERSDVGSQPAESDYDVEEEYDNDYAENYFDNGEGDDIDDMGGGGGEDAGGGDYD